MFLTIVERKTLHLLVKGRTNKQIAFELQTTEQRIKNVVSRIYKKFGIHSRANCILKYYEKPISFWNDRRSA